MRGFDLRVADRDRGCIIYVMKNQTIIRTAAHVNTRSELHSAAYKKH